MIKRQNSAETEPLLERSDDKDRTKPSIPYYIMYPLLSVFIVAVGFSAWYVQGLNGKSGHGNGGPIPEKETPNRPMQLEWKSQALGYASAALYLGSRVPQIAHN
jgi:hypothetical protein